MKLKISPSISLPLDAVTQTFAILAKKGKGKSYTASIMAEEMLKAGQQAVILDPTGAWWGLQSSADGKSEGFPVVVFGGDHANIPLEETAGEIIAQSIIEQGFSAIIDLSLFRKGQANRFVAMFLENLYRLNRNPLHLFVDEADAFAPQKSFADEARTLGAMEDIVRRGRKRGIGCTMITQRPAVINKNVLTQCEILITLGLSHPKDIDAVMEWVNVHAEQKQAQKMIESLPSLPIGTAWIWSPEWMNVFEKIKIRERETFDSGATPKPGEVIKNPKKMAKIDIEKLGNAIAQTVEKKKADDPRELKKKITELQKQLKVDTVKLAEIKIEEKEIHVLKDSQIERLEKLFEKQNILSQEVLQAIKLVTTFKKQPAPQPKIVSPVHPRKEFTTILRQPHENGNGSLGRCERSILTVLAQRSGQKSSRSQVGILSGYSSSSGGFNNSISKLRQLGYMTGHSDDMQVTDDGLSAVGNFEPLPTGTDLHNYWMNKLPKCEGTILKYLIEQHPSGMSKEEIGSTTNYSHTSGGFNNALSKLRTLELIEGYGNLKASDNLF